MCIKSLKNTVFDPASLLLEFYSMDRIRDAGKDLDARTVITASFIIMKNRNNLHAQQRRHSYVNYSIFTEYYATIENLTFKDFQIIEGNVLAIHC